MTSDLPAGLLDGRIRAVIEQEIEARFRQEIADLAAYFREQSGEGQLWRVPPTWSQLATVLERFYNPRIKRAAQSAAPAAPSVRCKVCDCAEAPHYPGCPNAATPPASPAAPALAERLLAHAVQAEGVAATRAYAAILREAAAAITAAPTADSLFAAISARVGCGTRCDVAALCSCRIAAEAAALHGAVAPAAPAPSGAEPSRVERLLSSANSGLAELVQVTVRERDEARRERTERGIELYDALKRAQAAENERDEARAECARKDAECSRLRALLEKSNG